MMFYGVRKNLIFANKHMGFNMVVVLRSINFCIFLSRPRIEVIYSGIQVQFFLNADKCHNNAGHDNIK